MPGCGTPLGAEPGDIADTDMLDAAAPPVATAPTVASVAIVTAVSMISTAKYDVQKIGNFDCNSRNLFFCHSPSSAFI